MGLQWWCDLDGGFVAPAEILGEVFPARINDHDVTVHLPTLPSNSESWLLAPPLIWNTSEASDNWGTITQYRHRQAIGVVVERLVIVADVSDLGDELEGVAQAVVDATEAWRDDLKTWLEIVTGQHMTDVGHRKTRYIGYRTPIDFVSADGLTRQHVNLTGTVNITIGGRTEVPAVTSDVLTGCLSLTSSRIEPKLAWVLLRDARSLAKVGQYRRAIIDSATAAELAITSMLEARLEGMPEDQGNKIRSKHRMLGAKIEWLLERGEPLREDLYANLVEKRNDAVHEAKPVSPGDCGVAIAAAASVLETVFPLPASVGARRW